MSNAAIENHRHSSRLRELLKNNSVVIVFATFVVFATIASGGRFAQPANITVVLFQSSIIGVLAVGQTIVMLAGGIDLSMVAIAIVSAIIMGGAGSERQQAMMLSGVLPYVGFLPAILLAVTFAVALGFLNGIMIAVIKVPAFIATLAMALLMSGVALMLTGGGPIYYPDPFFIEFGQTKILSLALPVYVFLALSAAAAFALRQSWFGVALFAVGGNPRAARLSAIRVADVTIAVYAISGALAALAGFLFLARTGFVAPASGQNLLLTTIASIVVGGVSLAGGKGSIKNAFIGVLLLACLSNLMNILLISPHIQDAVSGVIILAAVMINKRMDPDLD